MADGLGWIGEHWYSGAIVKDGMLSNICLTAIRGVDPVDWVVRLGADRRMAEHPPLFKDFDRRAIGGADHAAMFGRSGEWAYVLEIEWSTWHHLLLDRPDRILVGKGEELICMDRFLQEVPWVCYVDAVGELHSIEPGESLLEMVIPPEDQLDAFASLDAAMREAHAVRESLPASADPDDPFGEDEELARRLWGAVGDYLRLSLPRYKIENGLLPTVLLSSPF